MIKRSPGTKKIKIKAARDSTHQNQTDTSAKGPPEMARQKAMDGNRGENFRKRGKQVGKPREASGASGHKS